MLNSTQLSGAFWKSAESFYEAFSSLVPCPSKASHLGLLAKPALFNAEFCLDSLSLYYHSMTFPGQKVGELDLICFLSLRIAIHHCFLSCVDNRFKNMYFKKINRSSLLHLSWKLSFIVKTIIYKGWNLVNGAIGIKFFSYLWIFNGSSPVIDKKKKDSLSSLHRRITFVVNQTAVYE